MTLPCRRPALLLGSLLTLALTVLLSAPCIAATTTIDFETPNLGDLENLAISPFTYEPSGVVFLPASCVIGLMRLPNCDPPNQVLVTGVFDNQGGLEPGELIPVRAVFPPAPAPPVYAVSVQVHVAQAPSLVTLSLFDASGSLLASASQYMFGSFELQCLPPGTGRVACMATKRVAYALVEAALCLGCECGAGVSICGADCGVFVIDNFTFGDCLDREPSSLTLSPSLLWPPDHRMVEVHVTVNDDSPYVLSSITSDEPDAGTGSEDLPNDIQSAEIGTADFDFSLRSERAGESDGRTYAVCYEARDASGNVTRSCSTVEVPHDRRARATLCASAGAWSLTTYGSASMAARDVIQCSVMVTAGVEGAAASDAAPDYADLDGDGREDVTLVLTAGLSAGGVLGGDPVYARWMAEGHGYLAEIDPDIVTGVMTDVPGRLEANVWPNPGRQEATLAYALPRAGAVRLTIYDVLGHEVARLVDGWRPAGRHQVKFPARRRSGIYLYRLEWEGESTSGKFAAVK